MTCFHIRPTSVVLWVHVHKFNAGQNISGSTKRLEPKHRTCHTLDPTMILLNHIIEIFDLPYNNAQSFVFDDLINRCFICTALIHGDLSWQAIEKHGFVEEAHGSSFIAFSSEKKIDGLSLFVDGTIQILPLAVNCNVGFIHSPAATNRALIFSECFFDQRQKPDCPAVDGGMVDNDATFLHHFFEMAVAEWVSCIPTNTDGYHF